MPNDIDRDDMEPTGILGLDFVNTVIPTGRSGKRDYLADGDSFRGWLTLIDRSDLLDAVPSDPPGLRLLMHEAGRLRHALSALFASARSDRPLPSDAALTIDRALRTGRTTYSLDLSGERPRVRVALEAVPLDARAGAFPSRRLGGRGPLAPLNPVARSALELADTVDPRRLRLCAASDCGRWFVDTSKGGRRKWCSMERCGNRAKAARYRSRHAD